MNSIPFSYIRVPKTASGSIDLHLQQQDNYRYINAWETHSSQSVAYSAHMRYYDFDRYLQYHPNYTKRYNKITDKLKHCYVFACVRNPWERLVAYWNNWSRLHNKKRTFNKWLAEEKQIYPSSLRQNIRDTRTKGIHGRYPILMPQLCYLTHNGESSGKLIVNYIVRFENLQEDLKIVGEQIGIDFSNLPHINNAKCKVAVKCYNEANQYWVSQHFKADIELFNYEYEGI